MDRNEAIFEREISKWQTGFRSGLSTREGIFNIRAVLEKMIAINKDIYICFIDYQKEFDRVYHQKIIGVSKLHRDGQEGPKDYSKPVLGAGSSGASPERDI